MYCCATVLGVRRSFGTSMGVPCDCHPLLPHLPRNLQCLWNLERWKIFGGHCTMNCSLSWTQQRTPHAHGYHACSSGIPSGCRLLVSATLSSIPSTRDTWKEAVLARVVANLICATHEFRNVQHRRAHLARVFIIL